uniref:Uncharacterized protein n=1 Tax=Siphoviridae sp. ctevH2 TaxID=2825593 RepID=A0A8S5UAL5_9CAUD|nr:MAG TPA: hypothetical protein [Siphoviridae sp. ctevH2]
MRGGVAVNWPHRPALFVKLFPKGQRFLRVT